MITVGIDARFLTYPQHGGFKTYTVNLVKGLARVDRDNRYLLFVDGNLAHPGQETGAPGEFRPGDLPDNFQVQAVQMGAGAAGVVLREQVALPRESARARLDLLHCPAATAPALLAAPLVVTIHDTIWNTRQAPEGADRKRRLMHAYYRAITHIAARKARAIIAVSGVTRSDIIAELKVSPAKVHVARIAGNTAMVRNEAADSRAQIEKQFGIDKKYVLGLGSADARKNVRGLLTLFSLLPEAMRQEYQLVIAWAHPLMSSDAQAAAVELGIASNIVHVFRPTDAELSSLYSHASAFVFPSLREGFGLPLLEAMACGAPVVAAENSSIPEVAGAAALYYPTFAYSQGAQLLAGLLNDTALAARLREAGTARVAQFSWDRCAAEIRDIYLMSVDQR